MRDNLIFGSHAIKYWFPDFKKVPNDIDYMSEEPIMTRAEEHHWNPVFRELIDNNVDDNYLDADTLYTIILSHLGFDIKWDKHLNSALFLKSKGCKSDRKLYFKLVKSWIPIHGKPWVSLKGKDSQTFFEDAVPRKYVHDSIHEAIAVYDRPLFERLIVEGVTCSEDAFNLLSFDDKILLVLEEIWTTALERYLIPSDFKFGDQRAYFKSFKKLATTMSSGYFKFFILDNLDLLYNNKDRTYIARFREAEKQNKILQYANY
jgi:hypothetical protein